jgi:elongator complex protein 3
MNKVYDNFIKLAIEGLPKTDGDFQQLKKEICYKLQVLPPTNADLRDAYNKLLKNKKIKRSEKLEKILKSRGIRTESGVAVVAVLTKSYPCPGKCLYCPTEKNMPKSYLSNEPAVMRAIKVNFNPYRQVQTRIKSLELNGHNTDKIELIVMGGTFSALPKAYQKKFILECFRACNDYGKKFPPKADQPMAEKVKTKKGLLNKYLLKEQRKNEKAKHRIIGLTLETRPDYINEKEIINFRNLGCTRVELGVQSVFDLILKKNNRGHNVQETIKATKLLKDAGFKVGYHIMPGLYGSDIKRDYLMFEKLFNSQEFQPDMLKIYPTLVIKGSGLYKVWKDTKPRTDLRSKSSTGGKYKPLTDKQFEKFILKVKKNIIPLYVRISRLVRDVPSSSIVAGPIISNIRQLIEKDSACQCIRCREVGADYNIKDKIILNRIDYKASDGREIFLQYVSPDKKKLFALLRLRITSQKSAIIREVHTYGKLTEISKKDKSSPQHIGLGKKLVAEAEKIAKKEFELNKIVIISGVGVREYYRKLGYSLEDTYMIKKL